MINGEIFALLPIHWPQVTRSGINMEYWLDQSEASPGLFTWAERASVWLLARSWEVCGAKLPKCHMSGSEEEGCLRKIS